jgi:hypothetical protein
LRSQEASHSSIPANHALWLICADLLRCRLEQFASGAVFCQLLDAYFKDAIPMGKVGDKPAALAVHLHLKQQKLSCPIICISNSLCKCANLTFAAFMFVAYETCSQHVWMVCLTMLALLQVNYHASNEYESIGNYKVLQLGFTAINLTRVRSLG